MRLKTRKSLIISLLLGVSTSAYSSDNFSIHKTDKQTHMAMSYGAALTSTMLMKKAGSTRADAVFYSSILVLSLGMAKELLVDDEFCGGDMVANMIGTGASAGMVFVFHF